MRTPQFVIYRSYRWRHSMIPFTAGIEVALDDGACCEEFGTRPFPLHEPCFSVTALPVDSAAYPTGRA